VLTLLVRDGKVLVEVVRFVKDVDVEDGSSETQST
jgi:hypothetical protein